MFCSLIERMDLDFTKARNAGIHLFIQQNLTEYLTCQTLCPGTTDAEERFTLEESTRQLDRLTLAI